MSRARFRGACPASVMLGVATWWHPRLSLNALTSTTGHPVVAVPSGLRSNGLPLGVTLMGRLYDEGRLLAVAQRLLNMTGFAERRPPLFS